jgi:hypothetical protein
MDNISTTTTTHVTDNPDDTTKKDNIREKTDIASRFEFSKNRILFNFENLIVFIRMFLLLSIFYMFVWIFRDKNADIRSTGQLFSLWNSLFCSVLSIYYIFTGSIYAALIIGASLCSYIIADVYYGYFHYHNIMCSPNGYIHHFIYILFFIYIIYNDFANIIAGFSLSEIPTFLLNLKHVFQIESFYLQLLILLSFMLFRVLYWGFLIYKNINTAIEYKFSGIISSVSLLLHIQWTWIHGCKTWKKYISK